MFYNSMDPILNHTFAAIAESRMTHDDTHAPPSLFGSVYWQNSKISRGLRGSGWNWHRLLWQLFKPATGGTNRLNIFQCLAVPFTSSEQGLEAREGRFAALHFICSCITSQEEELASAPRKALHRFSATRPSYNITTLFLEDHLEARLESVGCAPLFRKRPRANPVKTVVLFSTSALSTGGEGAQLLF